MNNILPIEPVQLADGQEREKETGSSSRTQTPVIPPCLASQPTIFCGNPKKDQEKYAKAITREFVC